MKHLFTFNMVFMLLSLLNALLVLSQSSEKNSNLKENTTLLLIQALFRHGERAPIKVNHYNGNTEEKWPGGLANLTPQGKKQHYVVGKVLRNMYKDFLTSNPKEVTVNSSSYDRCLRGAGVTAAALYEPEGIWKFDPDLNWQPIPVYYLNKALDKHLSYHSKCPRGYLELERLLRSNEIQEFYKNHQKMFKEVSDYIQTDLFKGYTGLFLADAIKVEKKYNYSHSPVLEKYFEEIQAFSDMILNAFFGSDLMLRLRVGPLLDEISENMKKKINGRIPDLKVQLYCAHDIHLAAILTVFNFSISTQPPNLATLLFELHKMSDSTLAVRLLYLNSTDPVVDVETPHILILDDCSEFCPLANFTNKFRHLIPDNWEQECQIVAPDHSISVKLPIGILPMVAITSILSLFCVCLYNRREANYKQKHRTFKFKCT